ncbi:MAG: hypothetical protein K0V04_14535, partial [Deltaproteobacteria bacterium]|nr:hypothetical protein [Deltaproteobacteria bacterium]
RKVPQAAKLRQHLSRKMEEISNRMQQATLDLSELKGEQMTLSIDLQDKLADLTLKPKSDKAPGAAGSKQGKVAANQQKPQ